MTVIVSTVRAEAVGLTDGVGNHHFSSVRAEVMTLANKTPVAHRFTRVAAELMIPAYFNPDFRWIDDIFYDVAFPYNISFNSIASTRYEDDVVIMDSGVSQRVNRWRHPLMEFDVSMGIRTLEDLHILISFFRVMEGRVIGFLYLDFLDFTSTTAVDYNTRTMPAISSTDQYIGEGDGSTDSFQLQKKYVIAGTAYEYFRPIYKPIRNETVISCLSGGSILDMICPGVLVSVDGVTQDTDTYGIDFLQGLIVFDVAPADGAIIRAGFWFHVPVRFDTRRLPLNMENIGLGTASEIKLVEVQLSETI